MAPKHPFVAPAATITWHLPGPRWPEVMPADLLLVHHYHSITSALIRFGEWLRPLNRPYSWCNHACIVETSRTIIQEAARGSVRSSLSDLDAALVAIVRLDSTAAQRKAAVAFAQWTLGSAYDYLSIVGDGLDDLTGLHLSIGTYGTMVCSAATARSAERLGLIPDRDPLAVQPADLARYWNITANKADEMLELADRQTHFNPSGVSIDI